MEKMKMKFSIPDEILFEIFSWLPVKSLMRFKCVSGLCNSLIFESDFLNIHRCRGSSGTKFLLHDGISFYATDLKEDGNISASLLLTERLPAYSLMNCANGLFCVWEPSTVRSAAIFNPSTREVRFLSHPNKGTSCGGDYLIGFEPEENKYKVFFLEKLSRYIKQWVLTLGIDESWREIRSISPYITNYRPSVCINGVIYQFVSAHTRAIAAFDAKSENFEIIELCYESTWLKYYRLIEVKGKLAVVDYHMVNNSLDLWILDDSPKREWKRHFIQFPSKWNYKVPGPISSCMSRDGKIVLIRNFNSSVLCWCYDLIATRKTRRWRKLEIKGLPEETRIYSIYSYVETLDSSI